MKPFYFDKNEKFSKKFYTNDNRFFTTIFFVVKFRFKNIKSI